MNPNVIGCRRLPLSRLLPQCFHARRPSPTSPQSAARTRDVYQERHRKLHCPPAKSEKFFWDASCRGFGIRALRSGRSSWIYQYRDYAIQPKLSGQTLRFQLTPCSHQMGLKAPPASLVNEEAPAAACVRAIGLPPDRGWGKAPQTHTGEDGEIGVRVTIRHIVEGSK
jgi:hypothetical protein